MFLAKFWISRPITSVCIRHFSWKNFLLQKMILFATEKFFFSKILKFHACKPTKSHKKMCFWPNFGLHALVWKKNPKLHNINFALQKCWFDINYKWQKKVLEIEKIAKISDNDAGNFCSNRERTKCFKNINFRRDLYSHMPSHRKMSKNTLKINHFECFKAGLYSEFLKTL